METGATAEINATFNSDVDTGCLGTGTRFYYGFDNTTPSSRVNLLVVLLHEFGHGLVSRPLRTAAPGYRPAAPPGRRTVALRTFTRVTSFDRSTGKFWNQMTDTERQTFALNNGNLPLGWASVDTASGFLTLGRDTSNGRVQLYAPAAFESGSSVSHWTSPLHQTC